MDKYYRCDECGYEFDDDHAGSKCLDYTTISVVSCPICKSIEIDTGYQCKKCNKWYDNEKNHDVNLCDKCYDKRAKELQDEFKVFMDKYSEEDQLILYDYLAEKYN